MNHGKKSYEEGRFLVLDGILYHRTKHRFVMDLTDRTLINTILHELHDSVVSGHLSEDRTLERVKTGFCWPNWTNDVAEYCQTGDRCEKENRATGKKFGMMIQIQEPKYPWEIVHMDWVTALPPGGDIMSQGLFSNEEVLALSEQTYLWRAQKRYSNDKSNGVRG
ncbi:hypothetical protein O181_064792 [Austropuccinia psidii MF-1]|uniref:Integrase zinc-binding domain-containing protein n=1 Tax=Austropuccinia psidii MF-1 TaxID=1389203 RepID=A0A9Q3EWE1_9BASI|nr:hypothetical protein [Austropuccinia psidii MF-1]